MKSTHNEAFYHLILHLGRVRLADGNAYRAEADAMARKIEEKIINQMTMRWVGPASLGTYILQDKDSGELA